MFEKLTPDFAQTVPLSLNPFKRHDQVRDLLEDPSMIRNMRVVTDIDFIYVHGEAERVVAINHATLFLGRGVLKKVARTIEVLNNMDREK